MKIRMGFVSNSSTSSFCAVLLQEDYDKIIASLNLDHQKFLKKHKPRKKKFGDQTIVMVAGYLGDSTSINGYYPDEDEPEEDQDNAIEAIYILCGKLNNRKFLYEEFN
jgi:hypothetical protein